jgi:hypothetical protein
MELIEKNPKHQICSPAFGHLSVTWPPFNTFVITRAVLLSHYFSLRFSLRIIISLDLLHSYWFLSDFARILVFPSIQVKCCSFFPPFRPILCLSTWLGTFLAIPFFFFFFPDFGVCNVTLPPGSWILNSRVTDLGPRQRECVFCSLTWANTKSKEWPQGDPQWYDDVWTDMETFSFLRGTRLMLVQWTWPFLSLLATFFPILFLFFSLSSECVCFHLLPPMALPLLYSVTLIVQYNVRYPSLYSLGSRDTLI